MPIVLALLSVPDAPACGGFACSAATPVLQNAERIVFGVDEEQGLVEMHVQITYEGAADEFAWIVPVPNEPDLFLTTSSLFTQLAFATLPTFTLNTVEEGHCGDGFDPFPSREFAFASDAAGSFDSTASGAPYDVTVVGREAVGPYDTVTLRADSTEDLLGWLQQNGYDLPDALEDVLAPYVSRDAYFVALKLRKGNDAGDLAPLALRYPAQKAIVPVQLTAISATPNMRMEAYVLGEGRGVPESYLHVKINDAAINWWGGGGNYEKVITKAADEAGGHAFATDYYGPSDIVAPLWDEAMFDEVSLRQARDPQDLVERLRGMLLVAPPELFPVLEDVFQLNPGDGATFYSCPDCFTVAVSFDANLVADLLIERVIDPLRADQDLLDRFPKLARMTSSLDAAEMTVDPVFVLNHDVAAEDVSKDHTARFVYECGNGKRRDKAPRRLELADGRVIRIPSEHWLEKNGLTEFQYIAQLGEKKAQVIEQYGAEGEPEVVADYTAELFDLVDLHNRALGCGQGGGCATGPGAAGLGLGGLAAFAARRRRR